MSERTLKDLPAPTGRPIRKGSAAGPVQRPETKIEWWEKYDNIVTLVAYMAEHESFPRSEIARAVEKPWNYEDEFNEAMRELEDEGVLD